jgi:hypothetical protein
VPLIVLVGEDQHELPALVHAQEKKTPGLTQRPEASRAHWPNRAAQGTGAVPAGLRSMWGAAEAFAAPEIVAPFSQPDATGLSQVSPLPISTLTNCERSAKYEPQRSTGEGAEHERSYDSHDFAAPGWQT